MDFKQSQNYIASHREETIDILSRFMETDVLLFWSNEAELSACQKNCWQPILDDLNSVFKLCPQTTTKLYPPKNKDAEIAFKNHLETLSDKELTACFLASAEMKSVLLGLMLSKRKISAQKAFNAAFLEELYQNKLWGKDAAAANAQQNSLKNLVEIERLLNC